MIYTEKTAIGDAGEFFFAFQIAYVLKWPCRLFDIDIGIDAQVEVLDSSQQSTGRFIGFQVKARSLPDEISAKYVTSAQLTYWKSSDVPVFVVLVHLPQSKMYLHRVSKEFTYPTATPAGLVRIEFDLQNDIFSEASRELIAKAGDQPVLAELERKFGPVRRYNDEIEAAIEKNLSDVEFFFTMVQMAQYQDHSLTEAAALVNSYKVGGAELAAVLSDFRRTQRALCEFLIKTNFAVDHPNDGRIQEFINLWNF